MARRRLTVFPNDRYKSCMVAMPVEIAGSPHTRVLFDDCGRGALAAVFCDTPAGTEPNRIWGAPIFQKAGLSVLGFVARSPHWFFPADTVPLIERTRPVLSRFGTIIPFGWSMGGYAALKYGRIVGADVAVAFSPQISIAPGAVGSFDRRFQRHFHAARHDSMTIRAGDLCRRPLVVYDPLDAIDSGHARMLTALGPAVIAVPAPGGAHTGPMPLIEANLMTDFLKSIQQDGTAPETAARVRRLLRRARRVSPSYWRGLAEALRMRRRPDVAVVCYRNALALDPTPAVRVGLVSALIEAGERIGVARLLAAAEAGEPKGAYLWHEIAFAYLMLQRPLPAVRATERAIELMPDDARLRVTLGEAQMAAKQPVRAAAALAEAETRAGNDPGIWRSIATVYAQAGDQAGVQRAMARLKR